MSNQPPVPLVNYRIKPPYRTNPSDHSLVISSYLDSSFATAPLPSDHSSTNITPSESSDVLINSLSNYTTLLELVTAAGLTDTLKQSADSITVLAPTNNAFGKVSSVVLSFLSQPENKDTLQNVLLYHVISNPSSLNGERYPPVIEIDSVLIPPSIDLSQITKNGVSKSRETPKWLRPKPPKHW